MFSYSPRLKRKRGVILSRQGWQRLKSAQAASEIQGNGGNAYTLEELNELTGLSSHTLIKVKRRKIPVDKQTLESYFAAFNLTLTSQDYTKPMFDNKRSLSTATGNRDQQQKSDLSQSITSGNPPEPSLPRGQIAIDSIFYLERPPVETSCYQTLLQPGALIRIKAPRKMGKSSLMARILRYGALQGYQTVFLSLQLADRQLFSDLDKFLRWFSASVALGMSVPNCLEDYWDELFGSKISCKIYFEQYLLARQPQPLLLVLDDVDRLFDYPELADEFFGLLRTWHEQAKNQPIWQQLRLVVGHSTEVYIPLNINKSPFNVGLPIELKPFTPAQITDLATRYNLDWSEANTKQLTTLTNGQPYLIQLALYSLWQNNLSFSELLATATTSEGIFAKHLIGQWWTLDQQPQLAIAFKKVVQANEPVELELLSAFKLESLGLVRLQGNKATPSCALYRDYFRDQL